VEIGYYLRMIDALYSLSGFGVGLLVGMTGVGGGSLVTPLLILLFGIHPATAVGTDLEGSDDIVYRAARVHHTARRRGGRVATCHEGYSCSVCLLRTKRRKLLSANGRRRAQKILRSLAVGRGFSF
jgi:hypothetical protein